jgi:hypothetical protein
VRHSVVIHLIIAGSNSAQASALKVLALFLHPFSPCKIFFPFKHLRLFPESQKIHHQKENVQDPIEKIPNYKTQRTKYGTVIHDASLTRR